MIPGPSRRPLAVLSVVLGMLLASALPAFAADPAAKVGIRPLDVPGAFFDLHMHAGDARHLRVQLGNYGTGPILASTFVADGYSMTDGGLAVRAKGDPATATTLWLDYPAAALELAPGETDIRSFSVTVPAGTAPGDYIAGLVIQSEGAISGSGSVAFRQVVRQILAVAITVDGPAAATLELPSAALRTTPGGVVWLDFGVHNTGRRNLKLSGEYTIRDAAGAELARESASMSTVFAGDATLLAVPLPVALSAGDYVASLCLADPGLGVKVCSGGLPLAVATAVQPAASPVASAAPASQAGSPVASDLSPVVLALGVGLFLGLAFGVGALVVLRRRTRRAPGVDGGGNRS